MNDAGIIILRPGSGLCNRLRAIGSAINLAREVNAKLRVEWFRCTIRRWAGLCGMRVAFSDLFEPIDGVEVHEKIIVRNDLPWNWWRYSERNPHYYAEERRADFVREVKANPSGRHWLWTCFPFYKDTDYSWLRPLPELMKRIEQKVAEFGPHCVGLHIRRSDNKAAIAASPFELFTEKIEREIQAVDAVRFFVSTDDEETKQRLIQRYGNRILSCDNVGARYTRKGEQDAVVDLFCLSRTKKIYGSYWSSFSLEAAKIGKVPIEILVKPGVDKPGWVSM